jgi:TfoX/Sxy family transcriptional regulator of competence genes
MGFHLNNSQSFYKKGDFCILNTNEIAIIIDLGSQDLLKPRVMVFAKYVKSGQKVTINYYNHPIEVDLIKDLNRNLSNIVVNQKLIDAIRARLIEKRSLVDYLFTTLPEDF